MHEYGMTHWEGLWEKLEQEGNVGLDFVINPSLYSHIVHFLAGHPKSLVADFGCGTNVMGIQLLFGHQPSIAALQENNDLGQARFNTLLYIGIEGSKELVQRSNKYLHDIGDPKNIATIQSHIDKSFHLFDEQMIDLSVSRNFLMHLSLEDFDSHIHHVSTILKPHGYYIFSTLNSDYELKKAGRNMVNGERYEFMHGKEGEYGTFYHYYKTKDYLLKTLENHFTIEKIEPCIPMNNAFRESHSRYYDITVPIAHIYVLKVKPR